MIGSLIRIAPQKPSQVTTAQLVCKETRRDYRKGLRRERRSVRSRTQIRSSSESRRRGNGAGDSSQRRMLTRGCGRSHSSTRWNVCTCRSVGRKGFGFHSSANWSVKGPKRGSSGRGGAKEDSTSLEQGADRVHRVKRMKRVDFRFTRLEREASQGVWSMIH